MGELEATARKEHPGVTITGSISSHVQKVGRNDEGGHLNNTWEWLETDWTLLTIPQAGHFVQHDAADLVTRTIVNWLAR